MLTFWEFGMKGSHKFFVLFSHFFSENYHNLKTAIYFRVTKHVHVQQFKQKRVNSEK